MKHRRAIAPRCRTRPRGFSLVELLMVIVIIALIGGIAAPRWTKATQRYEVDLAAQRIAADISLAQQRANHASTAVTLTFLAGTSSYQISGMADMNSPSQTYAVNLAGAPYYATVSSVNFNGGSSLTFDGFGTPASGGSLIVTVADRQHTLSIDASSGRVTIQ